MQCKCASYALRAEAALTQRVRLQAEQRARLRIAQAELHLPAGVARPAFLLGKIASVYTSEGSEGY